MPQSSLLIDGWKNSANNSKWVVSMVYSTNGQRAFVDPYDFTTKSETGDSLVQTVEMCKEKVKNLYNTEIVAVVSDNAANMKNMGRTIPKYHINCNAHTGNLLAKDFNNKVFTDQVISILKEFKSHPNLERKLFDNGGHRIMLPVDTRWCTYRDSYLNLKQNSIAMRRVLIDPEVIVKAEVKSKVFEDVFEVEVSDYIRLFDPVCKLISLCQSSGTSTTDSTEMWLNLEFEEGFSHHNTTLLNRKIMALNVYGFAAFYLHPKYQKEKPS